MCVAQTRGLFLSLLGGGEDNSGIHIKGVPAVLEGMGLVVCLRGVPNNAIPALAEISVHLFRV